MEEISFRTAAEKDRDFIRKLSARVFSIYGDYDQILTQWFLQPRVITIIASTDEGPMSFAMIRVKERRKGEGPTGELLAIAVMPEHQRQGMGKALLGWMEEQALQHGLSEIHLHTAKDNIPARLLFQKSGYHFRGSEKSYYPRGQSAVRMMKKLDW